jgi:2-octaprenyl-6-methoxyphenol hydroxylase
MQTQVDIAIAGGGPVGLAIAGMLIARGINAKKIALIDAKSLSAAAEDPRSVALSYGSQQLLAQIHGWPTTATPIQEIHISRRGSFGRTLIEAAEYKLPALGYVCRYGDVVRALADGLSHSELHQLRPSRIASINEDSEHVSIELSDGQTLTAKLAIQAEGGVFGEQAPRAKHRDYQQCAIVARVETSSPLPDRAFERFTEEGPLALLPQAGGYALVWCVRPEHSEKLMALSDEAFLKALQHAFGQRVGRFINVGSRSTYPLGLNAQTINTARTLAIGNAAQTLHPVAGQGLNLGLRDAAVLADLLAKEMSSVAFTAFEQKRQADRNTTIRITDWMARVFASAPDQSLTQTMLGMSLGFIDVTPSAKRWLASHMMFGLR